MIAEALQRAATDHVVLFLLTSYIDARTYDDAHDRIPTEAKRLPIDGAADVGLRVEALQRSVDAARTADPLLSEALHVFSAAAHKLAHTRPAPADLATRQRVFG